MRWQRQCDMLPSTKFRRVRRDIFLGREGHHCSCLRVHISNSTKPYCYDKPGISLLVTSWSLASHIHCKCLPVYETISWDEAWPIPIQLYCSLWHKTRDPWEIWPKVGIDQCSSFQHWLWEQKHGNFFLNILRDSDSTLHFEFDYHSISETPCFVLYFYEVWTSQTVCTQITYCTLYSMMLSFHRIHLPSSIMVKSSLFG